MARLGGRALALAAASCAGLPASLVGAGLPMPALAAARVVTAHPSGRGLLAPPRSIDLRRVTSASQAAGEHPALLHPFLPAPSRPPLGTQPPPARAAVLSPVGGAERPLTPGSLAATPTPGLLTAFPADLVAPVNDTLWVWSKSGSALLDADLNYFFALPSGYSFADPRVAYDATAGRWFLSGLAFDSSNDSMSIRQSPRQVTLRGAGTCTP
ncbi:MAG TPA: hypothetical protein VMW80_03040 [Candidatus Dormibacteraeota bacterium]|nr:hypothetical protein [Candidatus Dormibacteraeota bacterium]